MPVTGSSLPPPRAAGARGLLVLALLVGVLAMHGLPMRVDVGRHLPGGTAGMAAPTAGARPAAGTGGPHRPAVREGGPYGPAGSWEARPATGRGPAPCGGGAEGGHGHAATMCLADAVAAGYVPPAPAPAVHAAPARGSAAPAGPASAAAECRAPPDLSELQLLRI
ncbi:DUF6153 family protein [Streptomyces tremellae]|uniref:Uncharacterized protein n=1 Tax=Streptomyces tremellae TaxID=1124239 RepID=A0ABP7FSC2_9ACTN